MTDIKKEMKDRAWLTKGLVNALKYDADYIYNDVTNYDVMCLHESIKETKDTLQKLVDNVTELEYLLYLTKQSKT